MNKFLKRLFLGVALAAACCLCVFAAACGDESSSDTYTIKLVYADGTAVDGTNAGSEGYAMYAQFCDGDVCFSPVEFNENGIAQVTLCIKSLFEE